MVRTCKEDAFSGQSIAFMDSFETPQLCSYTHTLAECFTAKADCVSGRRCIDPAGREGGHHSIKNDNLSFLLAGLALPDGQLGCNDPVCRADGSLPSR